VLLTLYWSSDGRLSSNLYQSEVRISIVSDLLQFALHEIDSIFQETAIQGCNVVLKLLVSFLFTLCIRIH